jgi:phosphopantothenoylcysteine decarboxylase/phosphopantothenate--cysteine ligase
VKVIMTKHAAQFVAPLTFETLSKHAVLTDLFEDHPEDPIAHINLAKWADALCIVPATANILAKAALGMADDLVSSTILASHKIKVAAPAMNVHMYENEATQVNIETLKARGWQIIEPVSGHLACDDVGKGKLASPEAIVQAIEDAFAPKVLEGLNVLITAGPTREAVDPVRFISNHSTGKQGYAIAEAAQELGANVTLISGPTALAAPQHVKTISVTSAQEMFEAVQANREGQNAFILTAAVADFRPKHISCQKIKKDGGCAPIELEANPDILAWLGSTKRAGEILVGFAMETENLEANARAKLEKKNCDLLVANNLFTEGAGFAGDTNVVTLLDRKGQVRLDKCTKKELGFQLLKRIGEMMHACGD